MKVKNFFQNSTNEANKFFQNVDGYQRHYMKADLELFYRNGNDDK